VNPTHTASRSGLLSPQCTQHERTFPRKRTFIMILDIRYKLLIYNYKLWDDSISKPVAELTADLPGIVIVETAKGRSQRVCDTGPLQRFLHAGAGI
jgi:hypothetical protein